MKLSVDRCRLQRGYALLVLLLFMTLISIGSLAIMEHIVFQIKRDREEEFIHRGVEYSRAVRKYVKQFGRYPTSIEALENSNNVRFLRKRYKDPITRKDFKLLYYGDLETFYHNPSLIPSAIVSQKQAPPVSKLTSTPTPDIPPSNASADPQSVSTDPIGALQADEIASNNAAATTEQSQDDPSAQDTGGRAIVGVTSYSKNETIRVFNKKNHYNQWQFVYDPTTDLGLMKGPNQPLLKGAAQAQALQNGQGSKSDPGVNGAQK